MAEVENNHAAGRDVPKGITKIIVAVISLIGGIIIAVIGILPMMVNNEANDLRDKVTAL